MANLDEKRGIARAVFKILPVDYVSWLESLREDDMDKCAKDYLNIALNSSKLASKGEQVVLNTAKNKICTDKKCSFEEKAVLVWAAAKIGTPDSFRFLTKEVWALGSHNIILPALEHFPLSISKDFLISKLNSPDWSIRSYAAGILACIGDKECEEHVYSMLKKESTSFVLGTLVLQYFYMVGETKAMEEAWKLQNEAHSEGLSNLKAERYKYISRELKKLVVLARHGYLISRN